MRIFFYYTKHPQEYDADLAQKVKHERFRWHNFQWLETMTGETLYEEEADELDEDYLDPSFLHTAAELYNNPDLYYEMQSQIEAAHTHGHGLLYPPSGVAGAPMVMSPGSYPFGMSFHGGSGSGGDQVPRTRTLSGSYSNGPQSATRQQAPWSDEFGAVDELDEIDQDALSPRQHALLMQSMQLQDPLAMYSSPLDSSGRGMLLGVGSDEYDDESDNLGYQEGGDLGSSGGGGGGGRPIARWRNPMTESQRFTQGTKGVHATRHGSGPMATTMEDSDVDQLMLYSPGASRYNPSPTYNYYATPTSSADEPSGPNMAMMRSPVPPPPPSGSEGMFDYDDELDVHPAAAVMGYPGGSGPPVHMLAPPPSRVRTYRPPTRPGF